MSAPTPTVGAQCLPQHGRSLLQRASSRSRDSRPGSRLQLQFLELARARGRMARAEARPPVSTRDPYPAGATARHARFFAENFVSCMIREREFSLVCRVVRRGQFSRGSRRRFRPTKMCSAHAHVSCAASTYLLYTCNVQIHTHSHWALAHLDSSSSSIGSAPPLAAPPPAAGRATARDAFGFGAAARSAALDDAVGRA